MILGVSKVGNSFHFGRHLGCFQRVCVQKFGHWSSQVKVKSNSDDLGVCSFTVLGVYYLAVHAV